MSSLCQGLLHIKEFSKNKPNHQVARHRSFWNVAVMTLSQPNHPVEPFRVLRSDVASSLGPRSRTPVTPVLCPPLLCPPCTRTCCHAQRLPARSLGVTHLHHQSAAREGKPLGSAWLACHLQPLPTPTHLHSWAVPPSRPEQGTRPPPVPWPCPFSRPECEDVIGLPCAAPVLACPHPQALASPAVETKALRGAHACLGSPLRFSWTVGSRAVFALPLPYHSLLVRGPYMALLRGPWAAPSPGACTLTTRPTYRTQAARCLRPWSSGGLFSP